MQRGAQTAAPSPPRLTIHFSNFHQILIEKPLDQITFMAFFLSLKLYRSMVAALACVAHTSSICQVDRAGLLPSDFILWALDLGQEGVGLLSCP